MAAINKFGSANLLTRLFVIVVVATLPAVIVLVTFQHQLQASRQKQARAIALRQAELLNASIGTIVEGARQLMISVTHFNRVNQFRPNCREVLQGLHVDMPSYAFLAVTDPQGGLVCSSADPPPPRSTLQSIASAATAAGRFTIGTYLPGLPGQPPSLGFGLPFNLHGGAGSGVVIAALSLDWLDQFMTTLKRPADTVLSVVDGDGVVLAREPDHLRYVGRSVLPEIQPLLHQAQSGTAIVPSFEGHRRVVGYVPVTLEPEGLYVSAGFVLEDLTADIDAAARRGYLMIALGAALSLLLALIFGQRFVRAPTAVLLRAARGWGSGNLAVRAEMPAGAAREFDSLSGAFNEMAETLQHQRAELQSLNEALEARVAERTRDLLESRNRLQVEIAEREVTEGRLRQVQKLQAVGQLAGGIAHDFNNLLTAVLGSLELLRRRIPATDDRTRRLLDMANAAVERGTRLTAKLLGFSRKQPLLSVPIDVAAALDGMTGLIATTLGAAVWTETSMAPDLWTISVDPDQFEAAILNLALNARAAMPAGGRLTITAANRVVTADPASSDPAPAGLPPGDYVGVTISDTGVGMSEETLARAFEPFFTTQPPGASSGLGLSQVHGMVRQSGGDVRIDSWPGAGTRVTMLLPRSFAEPIHYGAEPIFDRAVAIGQDRTILLVDDDPDVREVTADLLIESGYQVVQAADGASALEMLADETRRIRFVICDYAMPGMTGRDLLGRVRQVWPDLPVLLITGYADFAPASADDLTVDQIVRKPFRSSDLLARIQMVWERQMSPAR